MRYTWLIFVVLLVIAAATAFGWWRSRRAGLSAGKKGWVANTGFLRGLPKYKTLVRRTRLTLGAAVACFLIAIIGTAVSAGAPVDRYIRYERSASRDIVLCLDASGSMLPYDAQIGRAFQEIVSHFEGERISLQLWNARSVTKFPLTDDYALANDVLSEMTEIIDSGYLGSSGGSITVASDLSQYLEPTLDPYEERASVVGDGLASCILGFDHTNQERSRTVLLATDNEVNGDGIYDLPAAIEFARQQNVTVTALYPGSTTFLSTEGTQLREQVELTGGTFYDASSPSAVDGVVREIESEQREELDSAGRVVETDRPSTALAWSIAGVLSLLAFIAVGRL